MSFGEYGGALETRNDKELNEMGAFFYLCQHFASKFLPNFDANNELQREKHFMVLDIAKQLYRNAEGGFKAAYKQVKLVE